MDKSIVLALLFIILIGTGYYFWQEHEANLVLAEEKVDIPVEPSKPVPIVMEKEEIRYPVPEQLVVVVEEPEVVPVPQVVAEPFILPVLNESDDVMQNLFGKLYEPARLVEIFIFTEFIRHIVVSVDNLTAKKLSQRFVFTQRPVAGFMVSKSTVENEFLLDNKNYKRYQRFLDFGNAVGNQELVSVYVRYYPLFQEAYEELGYPGRYFNDRVIAVIDHLLQTPDIVEPVKLLQPKVYYQFADPAVEKLSAGQKLLIRIGPENGRQVRNRLKDLRRILTTLEP